MARFLIEIPHGDEYQACVKALEAVREYGSHFVTHADWGCGDGVHCGWLIAELESRTDAELLVPPQLRHEARITKLNKYTSEQIAALVAKLEN